MLQRVAVDHGRVEHYPITPAGYERLFRGADLIGKRIRCIRVTPRRAHQDKSPSAGGQPIKYLGGEPSMGTRDDGLGIANKGSAIFRAPGHSLGPHIERRGIVRDQPHRKAVVQQATCNMSSER